MRKLFAVSLAGLAILAFSVAPIFAGENCAKSAEAKAACAAKCAAKGTSASAEVSGCPHSTSGSGEAKLVSAEGMGKCNYMSKEECAKLCADGSKCEFISMSIKGMTCGGCEGSITAALQKIDGVKKVVSVSYKDGSAIVCVDPAKVKSAMLTTAVVNRGFEAQIIPAVATISSAPAKAHACSPEARAACAAKAEKTGIEGTK